MIPASILVFCAGAAVGSFLGACAYRLPRGIPIGCARSACESCGSVLTPCELIPIVSYLLLKGKCIHCGARIPLQLFIWEGGVGLLFLIQFLVYGPTPGFILGSFACSAALLIAVMDWEHRLIPNKVIYALLPIVLLLLALFTPELIPERLLQGGVIALLLLLVKKTYSALRGREGLGLGDVRLGALMGITLGFLPALLAIWVASALGLTFDIVRRRMVRIKVSGGPEATIPFGSFLALATLLLFASQKMVERLLLQWLHLST